jgi:hypothetical protein
LKKMGKKTQLTCAASCTILLFVVLLSRDFTWRQPACSDLVFTTPFINVGELCALTAGKELTLKEVCLQVEFGDALSASRDSIARGARGFGASATQPSACTFQRSTNAFVN